MDIKLFNNSGYKWINSCGVSFKGYLQDRKTGECYREQAAISKLNGIKTTEDLKELLNRHDGLFSIIISVDNYVIGATDVSRSMPIYYDLNCEYITDNIGLANGFSEKINCAVNVGACEELLNGTYIGHTRTLFKNIKQLDAGVIALFKNKHVKVEYYFVHKCGIKNISRKNALEQFTRVSTKIFDDIIKVVNGRPIVLSLSGGYDSRYVACMLKERGAVDVSCYSYGKADSFEIKQSEKVARALGFRWKMVEHTDELMDKGFGGKFIDYFKVYGGFDCVPYIQNYVAVKKLNEEGWFKDNSVFITGLCNDMQSGAYVKSPEEITDFCGNNEYLVSSIIKGRNFYKLLSHDALEEYSDELKNVIANMGIEVTDYQTFVSSKDAIESIMMHSRLFLHMNDVHGFFGYEWLLPCWHKYSLEFWYSLPYELRAHQNLYKEWITTKVPAKYGVGQEKKRVAYTLTKGSSRAKARIRLVLLRTILYPMGKSIRAEYDYNNFGYVSAMYFRKLKQKKLLGFRNLDINRILIQFFLEHYFGKNFCGE